MSAVKPGQVWADNDPRSAGRTIRVESIDGAKAVCTVVSNATDTQEHLDSYAQLRRRPILLDTRARTTRISLSRFTPTRTGYRLVSDPEDSR